MGACPDRLGTSTLILKSRRPIAALNLDTLHCKSDDPLRSDAALCHRFLHVFWLYNMCCTRDTKSYLGGIVGNYNGCLSGLYYIPDGFKRSVSCEIG